MQLRRGSAAPGSQHRPDEPRPTRKGSAALEITAICAALPLYLLLCYPGGPDPRKVSPALQKKIESEWVRSVYNKSTTRLGFFKPEYNISDEELERARWDFVDLLGEDNVDVDRRERLSRSSTEWSPAPRGDEDCPSMIVYPRNTRDVSEIVKICHDHVIPIIAYSGGTSLEGTLAAQHQEVCMDFNKHMANILEVRKDDMDVSVQPGVGYQELNALLAEEGMFFPPDPGPGAAIGGMIGQSCSGTNAYRYGTMKDWVLGLTVVLADGSIIKTRHRPRKSSSGYDLTRLMVGSEGTLGIVTEATLKVTRTPENVKVAVAQFPSVHDAVKTAVKVVQGGYQLEAMELLDTTTMRAVKSSGGCSSEWADQTSIFFKFAGTETAVAEQARITQRIAEESKCSLFHLSKDAEENDSIWMARKTALWSLLAFKKDPSDGFLSADACVPISRLGLLVDQTDKWLKDARMMGSCLGHVGDGGFDISPCQNTLLIRTPRQYSCNGVVQSI